MKRDIRLEKEVERTIKKYNSIKRLPSAFHKSSSKKGLDRGDIIMIILCVLFSLFILSRIIIIKVDKFIPDELKDVDYLIYTFPYSYLNSIGDLYKNNKSSCPLVRDIKLNKNIESG